jgi:hypothetical protein
VPGSNLELLQRVSRSTEGVDVAPLIRAALAGDTGGIRPELVAGLSAGLDLLDPEVEIDTTGVNMPDFGVLRGLEGLSQLWRRWIEEWQHYSWTYSNWRELGEHVVVDVELSATGRGSGADVSWSQCQVFTFGGGKVVRWSLFNDRTSALAAVESL